ncbi:MAG: lipid A deacylase LpxR family protein [Planctomycetota bacterium]
MIGTGLVVSATLGCCWVFGSGRAWAQVEEPADPGVEVQGGLELSASAAASAARPRRQHAELVEENDVGLFSPLGSDTDEDYTQGGMVAASVEAPELFDVLPGLGERLSFGAGSFDRAAFGVQGRHLIFTPTEIDIFEPIEDDRPFAGVILLGAHVQRRNDRVLDHAELLVGAIGDISGAENAQSQLHQSLSFRPVNGWDNQVDDRFLVQAGLRRDWRRRRSFDGSVYDGRGWAWDVIGSVGQDLGNLQIVSRADATVRIGRRLADDFGPSRVGVLGAQVQADRPERGEGESLLASWGFAAFSRVGVRYVAMDITLDGHGDRAPSVNPREWYAEVAYGFEWSPADHFRVTWQDTYRTETFVEKRGLHRFASVGLFFDFTF